MYYYICIYVYMYTYIYIYVYIHIHQSMFTVSNSKQVYCILNNWCIWINLSCGPVPRPPARDLCFKPAGIVVW